MKAQNEKKKRKVPKKNQETKAKYDISKRRELEKWLFACVRKISRNIQDKYLLKYQRYTLCKLHICMTSNRSRFPGFYFFKCMKWEKNGGSSRKFGCFFSDRMGNLYEISMKLCPQHHDFYLPSKRTLRVWKNMPIYLTIFEQKPVNLLTSIWANRMFNDSDETEYKHSDKGIGRIFQSSR